MLQDIFKDSAVKLTGQPSDHGKLIKNNITAGGLTLGCPTAQSPTYNCFLNNFKMQLQKTGYNTESQKLRYYSTTALTSAPNDPGKQIANQMRPLRAAFAKNYDPELTQYYQPHHSQEEIGMKSHH